MVVAIFLYNECIPLNVVNFSYFQQMVDVIAFVGPVWGCLIMRQDRSNIQLINFMVYCKRGTIYVKSVDTSNIVKDVSTLCNLFVELVDWVGAKNIVHFVTDNGTNYKAIDVLHTDMYPSIKWSPCVVHCLNILLGDIGKMEIVSGHEKRASLVTKFVYNHAFLFAWLRKREGWTTIIHLGPTRYATTFIGLKSVLEHQHDLQDFFTSRTFRESRYYMDKKASAVFTVVLDSKFWSDYAIVVGVVDPLICVLCIINTCIGSVYDRIYRAKKTIKDLFRRKRRLYKPFTNIIKKRWDKQLPRDIHATTYLLNPTFAYGKENMCKKKEIMDNFVEIVTILIRDKSIQMKFTDEVSIFQERLGSFGQSLALESLKTMQTRCEMNLSVFERIHIKKRNKLEHPRLNDLVFIHYNLCLQEKENYTPIIDVDELNNMFYGEDDILIITPDEDIDEGDEERIVTRMVAGDGGI
ncbi:hypothetical protein ACS0TY_004014 [Phlomoides rotata]